MTPVILTGSLAVKGVIVVPHKSVSPFWVFPNPILERLLDDLLFRLCRHRFFLVEYGFFVAVLINIIKDTGIL